MSSCINSPLSETFINLVGWYFLKFRGQVFVHGTAMSDLAGNRFDLIFTLRALEGALH